MDYEKICGRLSKLLLSSNELLVDIISPEKDVVKESMKMKESISLPRHCNSSGVYKYMGEGMLDFTNSGLNNKDDSMFNDIVKKGYIFSSGNFNDSWSDNKVIYDLIASGKLSRFEAGSEPKFTGNEPNKNYLCTTSRVPINKHNGGKIEEMDISADQESVTRDPLPTNNQTKEFVESLSKKVNRKEECNFSDCGKECNCSEELKVEQVELIEDYDEVRRICRDNNIKSSTQYKKFAKEYNKNREYGKLPSHPEKKYRDNWSGWPMLFSYN